ncbi:DUF6427 family protein [Flagellimonas algicola]|uniref:O-antigen ligase-like membrane protein n=1 Tax=Flagellimonas algicola TaxID=2583815 RepID=A0ABY2WKH9_9FLAO|nr:DUF6427 family protein [Allomuricauda algicola]TMU55042.1 hypothetical protein FGG15_12705 [Allomuricauda algicola]
MISSFFGKTKPINYIVLSVFLVLFYGLFQILQIHGSGKNLSIPLEVLTLGTLILTIFVINQIIKTEKVTEFSSYAMLFFVLLLVAFSNILKDKNAIFASFFLLLAIWRLLAVRSIKNVKHKIFDASFLICVASLFYDWAIVFLILVFVVINVYDRKTVKNWIVPLIAMFTVFVLTFGITRLFGISDFYQLHYRFSFGFLQDGLFSQKGVLLSLIYLSLLGALASLVFLQVRRKGGGRLVPLRILFLAFILGAIFSFLTQNGTATILITFFPAAVFLTNFLETIKRPRIKELVLAACIVVPVLLFVQSLNQ